MEPNIVLLPEKEHNPFYMKATFTTWNDPPPRTTPPSLSNPVVKTVMNVLVDGKPSQIWLSDSQMKKFIEASLKTKNPTRFKRFMNWVADNFLSTNSIKFIRKHAGGRWEKWFVGGHICKFMWFRGYNSDVADLTDEGLPLLRALMEEENWN